MSISFINHLLAESSPIPRLPITDPYHARSNKKFGSGSTDKSRFYIDDHAYFRCGAIVNVYPAYTGITKGMVIQAGKTRDIDHYLTYVVKVELPKGHPEAVDENGEPDNNRARYYMMRDKELVKLNPKSGWDGK